MRLGDPGLPHLVAQEQPPVQWKKRQHAHGTPYSNQEKLVWVQRPSWPSMCQNLFDIPKSIHMLHPFSVVSTYGQ